MSMAAPSCWRKKVNDVDDDRFSLARTEMMAAVADEVDARPTYESQTAQVSQPVLWRQFDILACNLGDRLVLFNERRAEGTTPNTSTLYAKTNGMTHLGRSRAFFYRH